MFLEEYLDQSQELIHMSCYQCAYLYSFLMLFHCHPFVLHLLIILSNDCIIFYHLLYYNLLDYFLGGHQVFFIFCSEFLYSL